MGVNDAHTLVILNPYLLYNLHIPPLSVLCPFSRWTWVSSQIQNVSMLDFVGAKRLRVMEDWRWWYQLEL